LEPADSALDSDHTLYYKVLMTIEPAPSLPPSPSRLGQSSAFWNDFFFRSESDALVFDARDVAGVTSAEIALLGASIAEFQLGESSEGRHLIRSARRFAEQSGDPAFALAMERFIREEQRHAKYLGHFLGLAGHPLTRRTWPDTVFRALRHFGNLEVSIAVLVTAEILAKVYYPALEEATHSRLLVRICRRIEVDEAYHVEFQAETLATLRENRGPIGLAITALAHRFLFAGTLLVVWWKHAPVFRAARWKFLRYAKDAWGHLEEALVWMNPRTYRPPAPKRAGAGIPPLRAGYTRAFSADSNPVCSRGIPERR